MLMIGTRAEATATPITPSRSPTAPGIPALHRLGLGGVGVGVVLGEGRHDRAAGLRAVLPDALLLARVAGVPAGRPVRHRDVGALRERLAVLLGPRQRDELVGELLALVLRRDRLDG